MGPGDQVGASPTILHDSIRRSGSWGILSPSQQASCFNQQRASGSLTDLATSKIILAILATGEAFVVDRRPGQVVKADLRLPVAEGVSHRSVVVTLPPQYTHQTHRVNVQSAAFSPNGSLIYLGSSDGAIVIFNCRTKTVSHRQYIPDLFQTSLSQ